MTEVIGLGAGGHAKVVVEILRLNNEIKVIGLLEDSDDKVGTELAGVAILGKESLLPDLFARGVLHAFIGVGTTGHGNRRPMLYKNLRGLGFNIISAIHPTAIISASAQLGSGPTIMAGAVVSSEVRIGDNVIVNTGAIVDHDCVIGDHSHIATGACLSGGVRVGDGTLIGAGAVVRQYISIGKNSIVGAGAVVVNDIPDNVVVIGIPAKVYKETQI